ncbi:pyrimidine utilization protein D [Agrobacterium tumefaciens]|uniref:Putative carbamate hydrolase RutD n=1 Tax=Agrobacterium tumefaciens TaxID=358 RepID=A0AA44JCF5_AGRTU|nr:pyrimidine utilization protein D [Agrobacterium tumefaciens]NTC17164.1 pyrimidine utilization protein D [Agrobacterium tumefaciens]NTC32426.1 pyrimidine utilization protein D [Agrobacterium tumefaciens]OCJ66455.1 pyrimidine utilization protein D [Agrobacterium tumefaciens]
MVQFDVQGLSDPQAPTIILSSGLGGSALYWAPQMDWLKMRFRVVTYDHFGTNRSPGEVPQGYSISDMADDVLVIAQTLALHSFSFIGHALGGLIGLDIALRFPDTIENLILVNGWAKADPHSGRCFDVRIELLEKCGVAAFVKAQPLFLYPASYMADNAGQMAAEEAHAVAHFQGKVNVLRRIAALRAFNVEKQLGEVRSRCLVIATRDDLLVPYGRSMQLSQKLPNAELCLLDHGAHAINVTMPELFNACVERFLVP